jgi:pimeloyl-ACP methyl ester carboxylesterase
VSETALQTELLDVGGRATAVITGGGGEPLVYFHGGGIVEGFDPFVALAERFRFVAPLMPGFGATAADPPIGGIDGLVEHTARTLDLLGVERFGLLGHSLGGWLAASFAAAHGERVRRLVLHAPYGMDVRGHPLANTRAMARAELYSTLTRDPSIFAGRVPSGEDPQFDAARALEGRALGGLVPGPFDPALPAKLAHIAMPTLLIWGDDDQIVPPGHLASWEAALPHARSHVAEGVGHLIWHEHPPVFELVADFLAG